nr:immunoglobulin heavy chain junction region [Macaca mulatta]MOW76336.1 immunoglobulin heavy chain junction region [Macaca mulatta]MOW76618.1 immunoglobulin heavy chain junction region [Macaca mulatta]MOW76673.1 immunoglobulin heavy chain junction region [Macaca mulatta]MOW77196.1 immunoglobulin heavy chain junction region [Macaca mulatta]
CARARGVYLPYFDFW